MTGTDTNIAYLVKSNNPSTRFSKTGKYLPVIGFISNGQRTIEGQLSIAAQSSNIAQIISAYNVSSESPIAGVLDIQNASTTTTSRPSSFNGYGIKLNKGSQAPESYIEFAFPDGGEINSVTVTYQNTSTNRFIDVLLNDTVIAHHACGTVSGAQSFTVSDISATGTLKIKEGGTSGSVNVWDVEFDVIITTPAELPSDAVDGDRYILHDVITGDEDKIFEKIGHSFVEQPVPDGFEVVVKNDNNYSYTKKGLYFVSDVKQISGLQSEVGTLFENVDDVDGRLTELEGRFDSLALPEHYKGQLASIQDLPTESGNSGDYYYVLDLGDSYQNHEGSATWNGSAWDIAPDHYQQPDNTSIVLSPNGSLSVSDNYLSQKTDAVIRVAEQYTDSQITSYFQNGFRWFEQVYHPPGTQNWTKAFELKNVALIGKHIYRFSCFSGVEPQSTGVYVATFFTDTRLDYNQIYGASLIESAITFNTTFSPENDVCICVKGNPEGVVETHVYVRNIISTQNYSYLGIYFAQQTVTTNMTGNAAWGSGFNPAVHLDHRPTTDDGYNYVLSPIKQQRPED